MKLITLLTSLPLAFSASLTLSIPPSTRLPNPATLPPTTHAILHSTQTYSAPLTRRNTFEFADLAPGSYLATIHCRDYAFEPLRVDVVVDGDDEKVAVWQTFRGNEWDNKGEKRGEGGKRGTVVNVGVLGGKEYYQVRQGFSVLSLFKNPMILMALFSLVLIFGMPYLMENMDPETKAEFEEMRNQSPMASSANPAAQLQNFDLASWMAGKPASGTATPAESGGEKKRK